MFEISRCDCLSIAYPRWCLVFLYLWLLNAFSSEPRLKQKSNKNVHVVYSEIAQTDFSCSYYI